MKFENGTIGSIRSISQRGLASCWARLAQRRLPSFDEFDPGSRVHDPKQLAAWKVEATSAGLEFRALYRGKLLDEAFNEGWAGKTLTEITPPSLQSVIIGASSHCASSGCAVYTVLRTSDGAGHALDLERLLLPFGDNGRVQVILASLQLVSLEGMVERRSAARKFEAQSQAVLAVRISAANAGK
ncbi:hypothetical protein [Bradyrhizobium sp.]|uniref:hypothetical protein n=1 Tax=Bradyrhizobium sp. TaxID=376 RepID=UPI0025C5729E|nr:hypothetical protein [Bradyrhizobium sp.]